MKFMLDTNICIYLIKKKPIEIIRRIQNISITDVCISSITLCELEYGAEKSTRKEQNKIAVAEFVAPIEILSFDEHAATVYGKIRADLEKKGKPIGAMDLLIAAHALSLSLTIVTNNIREFRNIKDLQSENWVE